MVRYKRTSEAVKAQRFLDRQLATVAVDDVAVDRFAMVIAHMMPTAMVASVPTLMAVAFAVDVVLFVAMSFAAVFFSVMAMAVAMVAAVAAMNVMARMTTMAVVNAVSVAG